MENEAMNKLYVELGKVYLQIEQHNIIIQQLQQVKQNILQELQEEEKKQEQEKQDSKPVEIV